MIHSFFTFVLVVAAWLGMGVIIIAIESAAHAFVNWQRDCDRRRLHA